MQSAEVYLELLHDRGRRHLPIERIYRQLFNPQFYLAAYGKIYRNAGAMTAGVTADTVDGMSLERIAAIIEAVRFERYRWKPARRTYIPKKDGALRPLGMPIPRSHYTSFQHRLGSARGERSTGRPPAHCSRLLSVRPPAACCATAGVSVCGVHRARQAST